MVSRSASACIGWPCEEGQVGDISRRLDEESAAGTQRHQRSENPRAPRAPPPGVAPIVTGQAISPWRRECRDGHPDDDPQSRFLGCQGESDGEPQKGNPPGRDTLGQDQREDGVSHREEGQHRDIDVPGARVVEHWIRGHHEERAPNRRASVPVGLSGAIGAKDHAERE